MKNIITVVALLCFFTNYGQHKVAEKVQELIVQKTKFTRFSPLTPSSSPEARPTDKIVRNALYATADNTQVNTIVTVKPDAIEMDIPYNNTVITVQLYRTDVAAAGFHIDTPGFKNVDYHTGAQYRGIVKGDAKSVVSFNFFNNGMNGIISAARLNNLVVAKLHRQGNLQDYIIYSDAKLNILNDFKCAAKEPDSVPADSRRNMQQPQDVMSDRCVTIYFEIDYDIYLENFSDTQATTDWMLSVFNNVQTLYANDGITTAIKSIFIWTEPDPYFGESSSDYLLQFNQVRPAFDGDLGQLVSIDEGGLGGVAVGINGFCTESNFSYADVNIDFESVPLFSWTIEVITHELGHLMGSPHTHGCYWNGNNTSIDGCGTVAGYVEGDCEEGPIPEEQGTIMSYCHLVPNVGINFANGFGPQPAARILNRISEATCLSTDCINTCINMVANITQTASTLTSASITWTDGTSEGPWQVSVAAFNGNFNTWVTVNTNSYTATGLNPNTYYRFGLRPVCPAGVTTSVRQLITATAADYCSGITFTDTGGTNGNYTNDQHLVRTFTPDANADIRVTFMAFSIEDDFDFMYVYDGASISAPLIGVYTGNILPGPFESTAPDRSLTFEFVSDSFLNQSGWRANVTCANLGTGDNAFTDFTYYPNPSGGIVNIKAGQEINEVAVYNVAGQLLLHKTVNAGEAAIDISAFADGVYFFRAQSGERETNFRIIKQN